MSHHPFTRLANTIRPRPARQHAARQPSDVIPLLSVRYAVATHDVNGHAPDRDQSATPEHGTAHRPDAAHTLYVRIVWTLGIVLGVLVALLALSLLRWLAGV